MQDNKALEMMRQRIGRPTTDSPSMFGNWLAGELVHVEAGALEAKYTVRPEMTNPAGKLHGGVAAAIIDDLIGATMFSLGQPDFMSTVNLAVDYLGAVDSGEVLTVKTKVTKVGRQLLHAQAEMFNAKGRMVAVANSNLIRT